MCMCSANLRGTFIQHPVTHTPFTEWCLPGGKSINSPLIIIIIIIGRIIEHGDFVTITCNGIYFCRCFTASSSPLSCCLSVPPSFVPTVVSHGNSKEKKPFFSTWPSTRDLINSECLKMGPKGTIEHVTEKVGGILKAVGPGQLPRSEKQVTIAIRKQKVDGKYSKNSNEADVGGSTFTCACRLASFSILMFF